MRLHRFYVNKPLGEELVVDSLGEEKELLHQWTSVFRFKSGDEVFLFSDRDPGTDHLYRLQSLSKSDAHLHRVSTSSNIVPKRSLTLVMALVKKDTFETVVRQATELGVSRVIPLLASRSEKKNLNFERLRVISIEAAEQSGRGTLPAIEGVSSFEQAVEMTEGELNIVGSLRRSEETASVGEETALWVGPEGGWTEEEEHRMVEELGFTPLRCADTVLKADTAAVALLSAIQSED
jgi:16S rRNA (uracil1498-N3)-methyltransferase